MDVFTKDELETGMVVEQGDGQLYLVIKGNFHGISGQHYQMAFMSYDWVMFEGSYDSELKSKTGNRSMDVIKVYSPPISGMKNTFEYCDDCNLIWEREPEVDWSKVPVDTKIYVRDEPDHAWKRGHFAKYEDGKVYTFMNGYTSWTVSNEYSYPWEYAKLAEGDDE